MVSSILVFFELFINWFFDIFIYPFILSFITVLYYTHTNQNVYINHKFFQRRFILLWVFVVLIINFWWAAIIYSQSKDEVKTLNKKVIIAAHRGSSWMAPQNTLSAIKLAIKDKADVAEFDVQETKDWIVVLMHDENVKKTAWVDRNIWDMTYDEVEKLDVGSSFSSEFSGERVPTLEQVLDAGHWKIKMLIEIKEYWHGRSIIQKVNKSINEKCIPWDCMVHSTDYNVIQKFRQLNPDIKLWYILTAWMWNYFKKDFDFFSVPSSMLTDDFLSKTVENNKWIWVWTLNDKESIDDMIVLWVDGIITDYPILAEENISYRNNLSDAEKIKMKFLELIKN